MGMESHTSSKSDGDEYQIMKSIIIDNISFTYTLLTMLNYSTTVTTLGILFTVFHIIIFYISQA